MKFLLLALLFIQLSCKEVEQENPLQPVLLHETTLEVLSRYVGIYSNNSIKGTGLLADSLGNVITVYHVVQEINGQNLKVSTDGVHFFHAKIIFFDKSNDLALLRTELTNQVKEISIESQDNLQQGQPILLVGAPYELQKSFLKGFISSPRREQLDLSYPDISFIQTHGTSFPGCSGAGVFLYNGKLIGLNRATYGNSYGNSIGLVIPAKILLEFKDKFTSTPR